MPVQMTPEQIKWWNELKQNLEQETAKFRVEMEAKLEAGKREELVKMLKSYTAFIDGCIAGTVSYMDIELDWISAKASVLEELLM
jgi:hypothetical protein